MIIFMTGATGLVGGELLAVLSKCADVEKIYCLIRAPCQADALLRLRRVLEIHEDPFDGRKVIPVLGNLLDDNLPRSLAAAPWLDEVDTVIHSAANTSFSRANDALVEKTNIDGLRRILLWAEALPRLRTFLYVGTATLCGRDIRNRVVQEDESPNLHAAHLVKYTYTKMQGELLIRRHLPSDRILIARPSIIMGDSRPIRPRSPVILWAMAAMNRVRLLPVDPDAQLDIIPVDYAARGIVGLLFARRRHNTYHVSSGRSAATTARKLGKVAEQYFSDLPPVTFVEKSALKQMKLWARGKLPPNSTLHKHKDHVDYWDRVFEDKGQLRMVLSGLETYLSFMDLGQVFDNRRLLEDVPEIGNSPPADVYIANSMRFIKKMNILEGAIDP